ncbi:ComEC/Rec2 family competence protein [Clostridium subterminale]|uniref:ComEC/Rec2 family competence protein n=1 Tax=Clostridium subterminale TaxID=1550 RepID=A0ABN1KMJ7_CLOSU
MKIFFKRNSTLFILSIIVFIGFFLLGYISKNNVNPKLKDSETKIHFINVGQGDSILIENNNFNILIDSGPNSTKDTLISYLKKHKIKKLDYVIASHPHEDHIGSMDDIVNKFNIEEFIMPKALTTSKDFSNLIEVLKNKGLTIKNVTDNFKIQLSENSYINFLWTGNISDDNLNNHSIVIKYINKNTSFLFTGDMEDEIENILLSSKKPLESTVLKVAHHGSNTSSSKPFLTKVNPKISVISCGMGNDYGHPHKNTLATLKNLHSKILRTDINGNIIIKTNGDGLVISTEFEDI